MAVGAFITPGDEQLAGFGCWKGRPCPHDSSGVRTGPPAITPGQLCQEGVLFHHGFVTGVKLPLGCSPKCKQTSGLGLGK